MNTEKAKKNHPADGSEAESGMVGKGGPFKVAKLPDCARPYHLQTL